MKWILTLALLTLALAAAASAQTAAPVLDPIGPQSATEGTLLTVNISASDADVTTPTLGTSALPPNAGFVDNANGTGTFSFTPDYTQAGSYDITFYAADAVTSDIDSELVTITVTNVNQAPVLDPIGAQSVAEGASLVVNVSSSDLDGTTPTVSTSTLPTNASFTPGVAGDGTFTFTPDFTQAGPDSVTFYASDGTDIDSEVVAITVTNTNQPPVLAPIGAQSIDEGANLAFVVTSSDADGTTPTLTTSLLPTNASFTPNGDGTGNFSFTPDFTQAGSINVTFYASDGTDTDSELVVITVNNLNQEPVLAAIGAKNVDEGQLLTFGISASDADATTPTLSTSALPTNGSFIDNGNGTGTFSFTPDFTQAGPHSVTFYASDGVATDSEVVSITVNNVNQEPVLAAIGPQSVAEGANLAFGVSASDADGSITTLTTSALPTNASFTDNADGTGSFSFTPDFTQSGDYSITFYASDGAATDSEIVAITVTNTNQAPVLAAIGSKSVDEGQLLTFVISATDADGATPTLTTSTLPANAGFTDNGNGTGTFNFTPDFSQAGPYSVTFYASDGPATDSEVVAITVNNVNQEPVLAAIGAKSVDEGVLLSFSVSATDPDGTTPTFSTSTLPTNASFIDNGNGTGSFSFTPALNQAGSLDVTFYTTDGTATDSELVVITVNDVPQAPVLATIGSKSVDEGQLLTFGVSASDADGTIPALSTSLLPTNANFTDNLNGTGTFSFTPDFTQAGVINVTFYASDGSATDSEVVAITVTNVNQVPVLAAIGAKSVAEGANLAFAVAATDADGTIPTLTTSALPTNASFVDNGDGSGSFSFTPDFTQAGVTNVTFYASDGATTDSEVVAITVTNTNQEPVLAAIGAKSVAEGANLAFSVTATDGDGTTPALTTSTLPTNATFIDNGNGTGDFSFTPDFTQSGSYNVTFYASDGAVIDSEVVAITITNTNQEPVLAAIGSKSVAEGQNLSFGVSASDADATIPTLTTSTLPTNATFTDNADGTGSLGFTPDFTQAGVYNVTFYASDGVAIDSEIVAITVTSVNQDPVLATIGNKSVDEGQLLTFGVSAADGDGTTPSLSTSTLPLNASFTDNGNGTGTFDFTPAFDQSGSFNVTFYAADGTATDSELVVITVNNVNQEPVLAAIGAKSVAEGNNLAFAVTATDADGTIPTLSASTLPLNATFADNADGTGSFSFTPDFTQAGTYNVTFYASDGAAIDSEIVTITVTSTNQAPVLAAIGAQSVNESQLLTFGISATDADGTIPALTTSLLPANASFVDNLDGTGTFSFTPDFNQSGSYNITFFATDGAATDSEVVVVTVNNVNQDPVLAFIGSQLVDEGVLLTFNVSASDPDGTIPTLTTSTLPLNATFTDNLDGTGTFSFTPSFTQAGSYDVVFRATDGSVIDSELVTITVNNVNQAPVLAAIGNKSVAEGASLNFSISAADPDGNIPTLSTSTLPLNGSLVDNLDGTGSFTFTPDFTQAGSYSVTFRASDGAAVDSEIVTITVTGTNQPPILAAIGSKSVDESQLLTFGVSASDADGTTPALTTSLLPTNASFTDNLNGTGTFNFTPDFSQAGPYSVTFYASDGSATDSEVVAITVNNVNQVPVLAAIGAKSVAEGANLAFTVAATDADGTLPTLTTSALPSNASFTDNADGTGNFSFAPDFTQSGVYNITFYASDGVAIDSEVVAITVNQVNLAPVLAAIGSKSTTEGVNLNFTVSAADPDGGTPAMTTGTLPPGATFLDNGNGTGTFDWTPTFNRAGIYNVTFYAQDDSAAVDSEIVAITVIESGNHAPILAFIGGQSTTEGSNLNVAVSAADPDSTIPSLSTSALPTGASFIDNGDGTGSFNWTPSFIQAGSYTATFYASDGLVIDSERVTINVFEVGNQAPVLAAIGSKGGTEGINLTFGVSATDPDGTIPVLSATSLPTGANFTNNGNGTGTFSWTPGFTQAGSYDVIIRATDGVAVDSEIVAITIAESGNQAPVLTAIGSKSVTEGVNLSFAVSASDPDGTSPILTTSALPTGAVFTDNLNGTGSFSWTPGYTQAGPYDVTFYASDGVLVDSEIVAITVNEAGSQAPVLANITNKSTTEGANLTFNASATDPDGTTPILSAGSLPTGASFVDNSDGTGTFSWTPSFTQAGGYTIIIRASDGALVDSQEVSINVLEAGNRAPVISAIGPQSITEGLTLTVNVISSDPDGTFSVLTTSLLPQGASFFDAGDGTGVLTWIPTYLQSGVYNVSFFATDGILKDTELVAITVVDAGNQPPALAAIGPQSGAEGILLTFAIGAADAEGGIPDLSTGTLPSGATFVDNNNGTGTFEWTPVFNQAGQYNIVFRATDDSLAIDSELVTITIADGGNQAPLLATIGNRSTTENVNLAFSVSAVDPDSTVPALSTSTLPLGASFLDNADGTGSFSWTPSFTQAGSYPVTFYASDGVAIDSELVTITVSDAGNQTPVLAAIGARSTTENVQLTFIISATDPDGTTPSFTTSALPIGAVFTDNLNGTATFDWTPDFTQSGSHNIVFRATDGSLTDSELVVITVNEAGNQPPVLAAIGGKSVTEGQVLNFGVSASDADGTFPALSSVNLPTNASFVDNGNGTGTLNFAPSYIQAASYNVTFIASDGIVADSEVVTITVNEAGNQEPILAAIGNKSISENASLTFGVSATDVDQTTPVLTTSALPTGAVFTDNLNGTGTFSWTPGFEQSGSYPVTFYASDGLASDSESIVITVTEVNLPPSLATIGPKAVAENATLSFSVSATDPDLTTPVLTSSALPAGATFADNGDGSGSFDWTPDFTQSGGYSVTFYASDGQYVDSEVVAITVNNTNRAPVANAGPDQSGVFVNSTVSLDGTASNDPDLQSLTYAWSQVSGATVTLSGGTTATPSFVPPLAGTYVIELRVNDGSLPSAPDTVSVSAVNAAAPQAITDLSIAIVSDNIALNWSAVTLDTTGVPTTVGGYIIYRDTIAYFTPEPADSIGAVSAATLTFTDNNTFGANVVGDTTNQYFYVVLSYDVYGNRSAVSNRVGEYDYALVITANNDFNLICVPFENTGITSADQLIAAIGSSNVNTVNNYKPLSQSFESRFAAGFGVNFAVIPGGVYQVNAAQPATFSVAGRVPAPGAISYQLLTTTSTDYTFLSVPFDRESQFLFAQDVLDNVPGGFNTLNRFVATSQSYQSRFAAGFGTNFPVKAGKPYQANNAGNNVFPQ